MGQPTTILAQSVSISKKETPMKNNILKIIALTIIIWGCEKEETLIDQDFIFVKKYCAKVTVGGVVGITERCFEIGGVIVGYKKNEGTITIRIAKHNPLNDGPPSSASYQELLDVPLDYLRLKK